MVQKKRVFSERGMHEIVWTANKREVNLCDVGFGDVCLQT